MLKCLIVLIGYMAIKSKIPWYYSAVNTRSLELGRKIGVLKCNRIKPDRTLSLLSKLLTLFSSELKWRFLLFTA